MWISPMFRDFQAISGSIRIIFRKGEKCFSTQTQKRNDEARKEVAMARLTERAFENAVVRLRDGMIRKDYRNEHRIPAEDLEW